MEKPRAVKAMFELEKLGELVKAALKGAEPLEVLRELEAQNGLLKELYQKEPGSATANGLMEVALRLTGHARRLAEEFGKRGELRFEEAAWALRCRPVLTTQAHRRELVGPVMLDWADCNRRLGNTEKADFLYEAIVKDFSGALAWGPEEGPRAKVALDTLRRALLSSSRDYGSLLQEVEQRLSDFVTA